MHTEARRTKTVGSKSDKCREENSLVSRWLCLPWRVLCEAACGRLQRDPWDPDVKGTQEGEGHVWGTRGRRGCWDRCETWRCFKCIWSRDPSWSASLLIAKYESPTTTFNSVCNYSSRAGSKVEKASYWWSFFCVPLCPHRYAAGLRTPSQGICLKCNFSVGLCSWLSVRWDDAPDGGELYTVC